MRFSFVSLMEGAPWGGSETLWSQAALRLAHSGHQIAVSVKKWDKPHPTLALLQESKVEIWARSDDGFARTPVNEWLRNFQPDLVVFSSGSIFDAGLIEWMAECLSLNLPFVTKGSANSEYFWPDDHQRACLKSFFPQARRCFFVSEGNRQLFEQQVGVELTNATIVRSPFKVAWDANPPWPEHETGWRLACVSRLDTTAKGQDILFRVLAADKWHTRPVDLSLFGSGPHEESLRTLARTLGIADKVHFRGEVSDIEAVWRDHHALVVSSRFEGLPVALVEAMLCGRTAIVTDVAGNAEVLEDGVSGFVAEGATPEQLDHALEGAWSLRAQWQELGKRAARQIRKLVPQDPGAVFAELLRELAAQASISKGNGAVTARGKT